MNKIYKQAQAKLAVYRLTHTKKVYAGVNSKILCVRPSVRRAYLYPKARPVFGNRKFAENVFDPVPAKYIYC